MKRLLAAAIVISLAGGVVWLSRRSAAEIEENSAPATVAPAKIPLESENEAVETPPESAIPQSEGAAAKAPRVSPAEKSFRLLARETWDKIPLKSALRARSSAELHAIPSEIIEASTSLGVLEEAIDADPALLSLGLKFFRACAINDDFATSTRALCLHRLELRRAKVGLDPETFAEGEISPQVRSVSEQLN